MTIVLAVPSALESPRRAALEGRSLMLLLAPHLIEATGR